MFAGVWGAAAPQNGSLLDLSRARRGVWEAAAPPQGRPNKNYRFFSAANAMYEEGLKKKTPNLDPRVAAVSRPHRSAPFRGGQPQHV